MLNQIFVPLIFSFQVVSKISDFIKIILPLSNHTAAVLPVPAEPLMLQSQACREVNRQTQAGLRDFTSGSSICSIMVKFQEVKTVCPKQNKKSVAKL